MFIFVVDFIVIILILAMVLGLGYMIISNIVTIVVAIIIAIVELILIFLLLKAFDKFFPKIGFFLWILTLILLLIVIFTSSYQKYHAYYVYVTVQDIVVAEHEKGYAYWTDEDRQQFSEDLQNEHWITIPKGTQLQTKSLYYKFEYNPFYSTHLSDDEVFIYNGKKIVLPFNLVELVGEKPIWGKIEYKE